MEAGDTGMGEGLKKEKSDAGSKADFDIELEEQSEVSAAQGEFPEKAQQKIDKLLDKTNQIDELLEEMRELKGLENKVKILEQNGDMLEQENEQLRKELDQRALDEAKNKDSTQEQKLIIQTQTERIE